MKLVITMCTTTLQSIDLHTPDMSGQTIYGQTMRTHRQGRPSSDTVRVTDHDCMHKTMGNSETARAKKHITPFAWVWSWSGGVFMF